MRQSTWHLCKLSFHSAVPSNDVLTKNPLHDPPSPLALFRENGDLHNRVSVVRTNKVTIVTNQDTTAATLAGLTDVLQVAKCRVGPLSDADAATELLNNGATKVIATEANLAVLDGLPKGRIVVMLDTTKPTDAVVKTAIALSESVGGFLLDFQGAVDAGVLATIKAVAAAVKAVSQVTVSTNGAADGMDLAAKVKALDSLGAESQLASSEMDDASLAVALSATLTTDRPDGLYSTIVATECGKVLGMAFSSTESIREAFTKRRGIYQSRKRGLWVKGGTSGNHQDLLGVAVDCDRDAIVFTVVQHGDGFCHRNSNSCFGEEAGFEQLQTVLRGRLENAPEGSYTKRLFEDPAMLKAKLVEEAIELAEAETKEHVAQEAADLIYFAMVACTRAGVSVADVEKVLDRRHLKVKRRPGNIKPEFIAAYMGGAGGKEGGTVAASQAPKQILARIRAEDVPALHRDPVDPFARGIAETILKDIREKGEPALIEHATRLGDMEKGAKHILLPAEMKAHYDSLSDADRGVLDRTAARIKLFAQTQRDSITETSLKLDGGEAGQSVAAVDVAGCYAPGGRYPLPSSVLMGAVTARVAGVKTVWVASPHPDPVTCAAAYVAGADGLLMVGGAQAIGAFAYGAGDVPVCDAIVGPGNKFVTAAKSMIAGAVAIDMLAGPSECLVLADETSNPTIAAADLIAQAEHDTAARALLVCTSEDMISQIDLEIQKQLETLPTVETARAAIVNNSFAVKVSSIVEAADIVNRLAPEHLEIHTKNSDEDAKLMNHFGAIFIGMNGAEVLGDYGAGPNHTLPTGGTARSYGGLSVHTFLRCRTWLRVDDCEGARVMIQDAVDLALTEGLHGHSRAASLRLPGSKPFAVGEVSGNDTILTRIRAEDVPALHRDPVDPFARGIAETILKDIREKGEPALIEHATRLGDMEKGAKHILLPAEMKAHYDSLSDADRGVLDRTAARIKLFAQTQRDSITETSLKLDGGEAGQSVAAVDVAGCYAPGGRYPLPSSVLMGAVTARVAGVKTVWVASPHPDPVTCAAAYVAGADGLLMVGGAQAIGAFAYGAGDVPVCDAIVGPGNKFVTAAKSMIAGAVAIDMLAGPSECLVLADETSNPTIAAADLIAQAEHDTAARALLVCTSEDMISQIDLEIQKQLETLPTVETARAAIVNNSFAVKVSSIVEAADIVNRLAPEHLEIHTKNSDEDAKLMNHFGAIFIGMNGAEVLGDYGAGPNHTLPTGGTARSYGGLSVHTFLRCRTWLRVDDCEGARVMIQDAVDLALTEGLHGHSRAASLRLT